MTTSDGEQHNIKPIIVSHLHDYQDYEKHNTNDIFDGSGRSSLENSPQRRVAKSSSSSFKRVSFGNSKGTVVQTYVYESVPTVEEGYSGPLSPSLRALAQISESPSKVKVTSSESEYPHSIHPALALDTSGGEGGSLDRRVQIISPPLPSLRRMEVENPFRPDGRLSHEVDPIVETYKNRPYPPSGHDSMDGLYPITTMTQSPPLSPTKSSTNGVYHQEIHYTLSTEPEAHFPQQQQLQLKRNSANQLEVQHKHVASAKTGQLQVVHIEAKKRKCGCCTIQ